MRASQQGGFPLLYRLSLGSPFGIDGYSLRHVGLSFRQFRSAVLETRNDENLRWFLHQAGVNASTIANGNEYGPKLGSPGYPGSLVLRVIKWFVYSKALKHPVNSLFEMIEQDEAP